MSIEPPVTSPRDLAGAYAVLAGGSPDAPVRPVAGGTDLLVTITGELAPPPASVVDLWAIDSLRGIAIDGDALTLGALTTYTDIRRSALCREHVPALVEAAGTIGAAQIQNRGTLGGNIANASPAGDTLPVLLAADAVMCFEPGDQGGAYCGNPLMAAVGLAVIDAVAQPSFLAAVNQRSTEIEQGLAGLIQRRGLAGQRGRGLLRALDLGRPIANQVVDAARALAPEGLLLNAPRPNLLRFMPALNVSADEMQDMLGKLEQVLGES